MPDRSLHKPVAVINRFEVKGDAATFERLFREHSQFLRRRDDFDFLVTVRLVERPDVYAHIGHWRTLRGFLDTVNDRTFQLHVKELGPLVDAEADQAVSVARVLRENAVVGAENVVLTRVTVREDPYAFERGYAEMNEHFGTLGGFGGSDLLRSTLHPGRYTGLQWWRNTADCDRALDSAEYRALRHALGRRADIEVDRTRHVAYERVIC
ncbi:antibiotic biosynthesis monooxygenase family protein [Streptomyces lavendulocolor]|uniref:antibiotic biosynthesis monooxygenase family protein n=1 Tax=Streptomyces lavendulocolor TaxID=67316 RepID=UPI003C2E8677